MPTANSSTSESWIRLFTTVVYRVFRYLQSVSPTLYIVLVLLTTSEHVSAQADFESLATTCAYKKAYAVIIKLLAVYASHVVTIKVEPGLDLWATTLSYVTAALLPSSSALVSCRDITYRYRSFKKLPQGENKEITGYYRNMQKAINAGSVCVRAKRNLVKSGWEIEKSRKIRGRPLGQDEVFLMVPRGTSARIFEPIMIDGNSQFLQVFVGAIQLGLATMQLYSASSPRIKAYGYGAFIYTIIPYAIGSAVNVISGILVNGYSDLTEMELKYTELEKISSERSAHSDKDSDCQVVLDPELSLLPELFCITLQIYSYLGIVGGLTRFRPGISTRAQRGWFISWPLLGMLYGQYSASKYRNTSLQTVKITTAPQESSTWDGRHEASEDAMPRIVVLLFGAATIGGVVAMVQQYLHFIEC